MKASKNFQNLSLKIEESRLKVINEEMQVCESFKTVVCQAGEQGRVIKGIFSSAKHLQRNPDDVLFCILPVYCEDPTLHIHLTLVEAFCIEEGIHLIKVVSFDKLKKILIKKKEELEENSIDFNCFLIQMIEDQKTKQEKFLSNYFEALDIQGALVLDLI